MIAETIPQLHALAPAQKLELAAELWADALRHEGEIADPPGVAAMLEERLTSYRAGEMKGRSWEEVRAAIQKRN